MNYDTRKGIYPRVDSLGINYPANGSMTIEYTEREAIVIDGESSFLESG